MNLFAIILCSLICLSASEPTWTTLRITWSMKFWKSEFFSKMPLTVEKTGAEGFQKLPGKCNDGKFYGNRYMKGNDTAVVLIYDSNGYIAGIQTGLPKEYVDKVNTSYPFNQVAAYQLDQVGNRDVYFLTAYFVEPDEICITNRTQEAFDTNIGDGLWIQNGDSPRRDTISVPLYQDSITTNSGWVRGGCFPSMGRHYWYKNTKDMKCDQFFPFFLMYNRGKLTGFGFASVGNFQFSSRFEHPPKASFSLFLSPVPDCLGEQFEIAGGFTTMHVYFTVKPWNLAC